MQINNMKLTRERFTREFKVVAPDGRTLELFATEARAIEFMRETKDFLAATRAAKVEAKGTNNAR